MKVITSEKLPIKMWLNNIEDSALIQAKNLANHPFAFKQRHINYYCAQNTSTVDVSGYLVREIAKEVWNRC